MDTPAAAAAFADALSAMHSSMHTWRNSIENEEDERDIDSAQVFLEAAFWKMETIIDRYE